MAAPETSETFSTRRHQPGLGLPVQYVRAGVRVGGTAVGTMVRAPGLREIMQTRMDYEAPAGGPAVERELLCRVKCPGPQC